MARAETEQAINQNPCVETLQEMGFVWEGDFSDVRSIGSVFGRFANVLVNTRLIFQEVDDVPVMFTVAEPIQPSFGEIAAAFFDEKR